MLFGLNQQQTPQQTLKQLEEPKIFSLAGKLMTLQEYASYSKVEIESYKLSLLSLNRNCGWTSIITSL